MTVVVGYIPDQHGEAALTAGLAEARQRGTELIVVNASKGDALVDKRYLGADAVADLEERLAGSEVATELQHGLGSDVAGEIVRVARDVGAELIVIGLRRRTPVGKMLMGSVAQGVLIDAPCPVLAVKADYR